MLNFGRRKPQINKTEQLVQFRHKDAKRVAAAVRAFETSRRGRNPSMLPRAVVGGGSAFATARFTGSWAKDTFKTITFLEDTASTAVASNIFANIPAPSVGSKRCAVAMEGTTWILIAAEC